MANRFGTAMAVSAGASLGGGVVVAVGASAGQRTLESTGQGTDKLLGLNRPKVLKRGEARRKEELLLVVIMVTPQETYPT